MVSMELITPEQKEAILAEQSRLKKSGEQEKKGPLFSIDVSKDTMTAWVKIDPEKKGRITLEQIKSEMKSKGIVHGMCSDALIQCHLESNITRFVGARADYSQKLCQARDLTSFMDKDLTEQGEKRKGDLLVQENAIWHMDPQKNIYGKITSDLSGTDFTVRCGSDTRRSKEKTCILAAKTGIPAISVERHLGNVQNSVSRFRFPDLPQRQRK
ncbi:MAG: hypothetical protein HUK40_07360 [Desulfobacter sp.]|nr:hypothetical protein [Desulfobacter sp.]